MSIETQDLPPIDFDRYRLDSPEPGVLDELIAACRLRLARDQYCSLPGFLGADAVERLVQEVLPLLARANRAESRRNCYLQHRGDDEYPSDHPRNIMNPASYDMIAADLIGETSALKRLYYWAPFRRMVAAIVGADALYPNEDPLQPVNVICYGDGDQSAWHYDSTNAFTMTLMLQSAEHGGRFELAPNTRRGPEDEDLDYVREVLGGGRERVRVVSREAGELTLFRGCNSLHRVSTVAGERLRMMAVFVYEEEPGVRGDPEVNATVYGRSGFENA